MSLVSVGVVILSASNSLFNFPVVNETTPRTTGLSVD